ncbi:MAG: flavodoxin family protein [Syntrophobacterales bacterium]|jgi:multimeric flavodoxin WrbA|nr:flavodoxin family protein [Syntrophobacterales bacterium]
MLLVINGSPKPHGNLQRMLEKIAQDSGQGYELVNLAKLKISPCLGCVKCAEKQRCIQPDDMAPLYDKIEAADALIVGGVIYFGHPNAFTHTFLERLFPLRHLHPSTIGKLAAAVCVGGDEAEAGVREISYHLSSYFNYNVVGSVFFNSATPPCFICGYGTTCQYGGPARWMTPDEFANFTEITPEMSQKFEDHPEVVKACETLSQGLREAIANLAR